MFNCMILYYSLDLFSLMLQPVAMADQDSSWKKVNFEKKKKTSILSNGDFKK